MEAYNRFHRKDGLLTALAVRVLDALSVAVDVERAGASTAFQPRLPRLRHRAGNVNVTANRCGFDPAHRSVTTSAAQGTIHASSGWTMQAHLEQFGDERAQPPLADHTRPVAHLPVGGLARQLLGAVPESPDVLGEPGGSDVTGGGDTELLQLQQVAPRDLAGLRIGGDVETPSELSVPAVVCPPDAPAPRAGAVRAGKIALTSTG